MKKYIHVEWKDDAPGKVGTIINKERLDQMQTQYLRAAGIQILDDLPSVPNGGENICICDGILYVYTDRWIPVSTAGDLLTSHENTGNKHVSAQDRINWDGKVGLEANGKISVDKLPDGSSSSLLPYQLVSNLDNNMPSDPSASRYPSTALLSSIKTALEQAVGGKANIAHATAHTTGTDNIPLGNGTVAGLSTNNYDTVDKNKVNNVPADTNSALANKVSSVSQAWKIYGTNGSSQQAVYDLSDSPANTTIVRRLSDGRIKIKGPKDNDDAADKEYVDTKSPRMQYYKMPLRTNFIPIETTTYTETISSLPDTGPFGLLVSFWGETVTNANHAQFEVWSDLIMDHHVIVSSTNNGFTFGGSAFILIDKKKFYWRFVKSGSQSMKSLSLRAHWAMKIGGTF